MSGFVVTVGAAVPAVAATSHPTLLSNCRTGNASPQGSWVVCDSGTGQVAAMVHCSKGYTSRWETSSNWAGRGHYSFAYCDAGEWRDGRSYTRR